MDKIEYFPRKVMFEEAQDLIATFFSTGDYFYDSSSEYNSMLDDSDVKDTFYYSLLLLSLISNLDSALKFTDRIIRELKSARRKKKLSSTETFIGEIDIETYIQKNYVERVNPKEYPSIVTFSTFQLPEYQITLFILSTYERILRTIFDVLGDNPDVSVFKKAHDSLRKIVNYKMTLQKKYGVNISGRESYRSLKKKVIYRYKNRKILSNVFKLLIVNYERIMSISGIDLETKFSLEIIESCEDFDDRLFEIWLMRKSVDFLMAKYGESFFEIKYIPLFQARKNNTAVVTLTNVDYTIEIWFQNRKSLLPYEQLKWFSFDDNNKKKRIGAIPDIVFLKTKTGCSDYSELVLIDAKNRTWTMDNMKPIKREVTQQIYICDNFRAIFAEKFSSMLIAHNYNNLQHKVFYDEDNMNYQINVVSMCMKDNEMHDSIQLYIEELCNYLNI